MSAKKWIDKLSESIHNVAGQKIASLIFDDIRDNVPQHIHETAILINEVLIRMNQHLYRLQV